MQKPTFLKFCFCDMSAWQHRNLKILVPLPPPRFQSNPLRWDIPKKQNFKIECFFGTPFICCVFLTTTLLQFQPSFLMIFDILASVTLWTYFSVTASTGCPIVWGGSQLFKHAAGTESAVFIPLVSWLYFLLTFKFYNLFYISVQKTWGSGQVLQVLRMVLLTILPLWFKCKDVMTSLLERKELHICIVILTVVIVAWK